MEGAKLKSVPKEKAREGLQKTAKDLTMFSHTPHLVISQQPPLQNDTAWSSITIYKLVSLLPFPLVTAISLPLTNLGMVVHNHIPALSWGTGMKSEARLASPNRKHLPEKVMADHHSLEQLKPSSWLRPFTILTTSLPTAFNYCPSPGTLHALSSTVLKLLDLCCSL